MDPSPCVADRVRPARLCLDERALAETCPRWPFVGVQHAAPRCTTPRSRMIATRVCDVIAMDDPTEVKETIAAGAIGENVATLEVILTLIRQRLIPNAAVRAFRDAISHDVSRGTAAREDYDSVLNRIGDAITRPCTPTACDACQQVVAAPLRCQSTARCPYILCVSCTVRVESADGRCPNCRQPRIRA